MPLTTLEKLGVLKNKKVLLRVDFNVPLDGHNNIGCNEDWRLKSVLPTLKILKSKGAKTIIISHLGRPHGKERKSLTLAPIAKYFSAHLGLKIKFVGSKILGPEVKKEIQKMKAGEIILLENLRFNEGEEKNNLSFAHGLALLGDFYINDAFAVSHRSDASVVSVPKFLPSCFGPLFIKEVENLNKARNGKSPLVVVIGGAKTSTKMPLLKYFIKRADKVLVGGGIANTFLHCMGYKLGESLFDPCMLASKNVMRSKKVIMPIDAIVGKTNGSNARSMAIFKKDFKLNPGEGIFDVGPATINLFSEHIKRAKTIIWNGAMGHFENPHYSFGTFAIARLVATHAGGKAFGVVGGGETVQTLDEVKMFQHVDHVSTGGGAMLDYLAEGTLPGIEAIKTKKKL